MKPQDNQTEAELVRAAQAGSPEAVEALLSRHERSIYRFGLRMCGDEESAREVLQETLLAAFKNLRSFKGEAAVSTWLYQIARSFCIKARRRGVGEPASLGSLESPEVRGIAAGEATPDASAQAHEIGETLGAALSTLPVAQREVIVLRDVEGLSAEEAATVLGIEVGALKSRLHRARLELRERIAPIITPVAGAAPCPELAAELSAYAADEIDQSTCAKIEQHLASCPRCTAACEGLKRTVSLCRRIPGDDVPASVRAAVRHALRSAVGVPAAP